MTSRKVRQARLHANTFISNVGQIGPVIDIGGNQNQSFTLSRLEKVDEGLIMEGKGKPPMAVKFELFIPNGNIQSLWLEPIAAEDTKPSKK